MSEVLQVAGVIKWFDPNKGFGFVTVDGVPPREDALLHVTALYAINATQCCPGAKVTCEVERGSKGLIVRNILTLEEIAQSEPIKSGFVSAQVKWYSVSRGYGFVTRGPNTQDVFIHAETVKAASMIDLRSNQTVYVVIETGVKGERVIDVRSSKAVLATVS